jgi:hypothetical protein
VCLNDRDYPVSLELHKIYRVLPDADAAKDGGPCMVDESREDDFYSAVDFIMIDMPAEVREALQQAS